MHCFEQKEAERLKAQNEASINQRRQQLADLYNREIEAWRQEAVSRVETLEDRKARFNVYFNVVLFF